MLHTETVEGTTLELLRRLQSESMLDSFCLAGEILTFSLLTRLMFFC